MTSISASASNDPITGAPPLFVTSYSVEGEHHEALVENNADEPDWLESAPQIRVQTPGGLTWNGHLGEVRQGTAYSRLLALVGGREAAWASTVYGGGRPAGERSSEKLEEAVARVKRIELWTRQPGDTPVSSGPLFVVHNSGEFPCFAVVRRIDKSVVHVATNDQFYIDLLPVEGGSLAVPRALVDTSLAGAFWGYTEHHIPAASKFAATRLLHAVFAGKLDDLPKSWVAAAAHSVLTHSSFLPEYGTQVLELLRRTNTLGADSTLLIALIGMALVGRGKADRQKVQQEIREAIRALAANRVTFGETLRLLDTKFLAIRELALREFKDETVESELDRIGAWLGESYAGGQIAAYAGEAPIKGKGWHDALAEKKTLPI